MIPPQEASARRREIEDKLKQVGLGLRRRGRRCGKGPRLGPGVGGSIPCEVMGLGARPPGRDGDLVSLRLLIMSSPPLPQEEETLSFIRDSLEKSDQLTKNMVSNPQLGRADRPPDLGGGPCDLRLGSIRPGF